MSRPRIVSARELKVGTGEVLARVAEGAVVYVTRRGKLVACIEPADPPRPMEEIRRLDALIDALAGRYRGVVPASATFARDKHREEAERDRRWRRR